MNLSDYKHMIHDLAVDLRDALLNHDAVGEEAREFLHVSIHEALDQHELVTNEVFSQILLTLSENSGAAIIAHGAAGLVKGKVLNWGALAIGAVEADLLDELKALGLDLNNPCPADDEVES